jgi:hypothetical protein
MIYLFPGVVIAQRSNCRGSISYFLGQLTIFLTFTHLKEYFKLCLHHHYYLIGITICMNHLHISLIKMIIFGSKEHSSLVEVEPCRTEAY